MFLPPPAPPIPILYKVTHAVVVPLDTQTELTDARRDGSAAGTTFGRMVNSVQTSALLLVRGRSYSAPEDAEGSPIWKPFALLGGRRVAVTRFDADARAPIYRAATIGARFRVSSARLPRRPATARRVAFGTYGAGRNFPAAWITRRLSPGAHDRPFSVAYARVPGGASRGASGGAVFGNGLLDTASGDMFDLDPKMVAILRRGGAEYPLKNFVKGNPDLGEIAWVSPEGWLVCVAYRGETRKLAWLEPVR